MYMKTWKKILIASLVVIAIALAIMAAVAGCEYYRYNCRDFYFTGLEKRVSENITMIHGQKAGRSYCRLKDVRTGEFTTPKLQHVFLNFESEDSLVVFRTDDKMRGYLNINTGKIIISAQYDRAWNFSEGLAAVIKDGEICFLNADGELAFPTTFPIHYDDDHADYAFQFHDGLCTMISKNHKWGLINTHGEWVVEPTYTSIYAPTLGYRIVCDGYKYGLMGANGQIALPIEYDIIRLASQQQGFMIAKDGYAKIVDKSLQTIVPFVYDGIHVLTFIDRYRDYEDYDDDGHHKTEKINYWRYDVGVGSGVIDNNGHVIIPAKYYMVYIVNDNMFDVEVTCEGEHVLFDSKGRCLGKAPI